MRSTQAPEKRESARKKRKTRVRLRSEEHTSELQSRGHLVCRLLLEKKKQQRPAARSQHLRLGARGKMIEVHTRDFNKQPSGRINRTIVKRLRESFIHEEHVHTQQTK